MDKVARDLITEGGYGPYFTHRLGHYIGVDLHDPGDIAWYNPDPVEPTMAFSCEPGVYLPGGRSSACKPNKKAAPGVLTHRYKK